MATFLEIAAHSVDHNYVLFVFCLFVILVISRFGFEGWIWFLIASVPDFCIIFTFKIIFGPDSGGPMCKPQHSRSRPK